MRISRIAVPAVVAVCALSMAGPATAQPNYPPAAPTLTVSAATVFVGEEVDVHGQGYGADENVAVEFNNGGAGGSGGGAAAGGGGVQPGRMAGAAVASRITAQRLETVTATTDDSGAFTTTVRLTQAGTWVITATGSTTGRTASVTVRVVAHGTALPVTSSSRFDLPTMLLVSGAALAIGIVLVLLSVTRRRRNPSVKA